MGKTDKNRMKSSIGQTLLRGLRAFGKPVSSLRFGYQLGLVISEQSVRLCLTRQRGRHTQIIETRTVPLDSTSLEGYPQWIDRVTGVVGDFLHERKLKRISVNIGLLMRGIGFRRIRLPEMPAGELSAAVAWEGNKLFPFDFSKCAVHYDVVRRITDDNSTNLDVNIVAADSGIIEALYHSFQAAGLKIGQVNFLPDLMARLQTRGKPTVEEGHDLVLYLDDEQSMAIFVHNGSLEFFQQFVTQPVLPDDGDSAMGNIEAVTEELNSFLDLYNAQDALRKIGSIILCGKCGCSKATSEYFSRRTGIQCTCLAGSESFVSGLSGLEPPRISESIASVATVLAPTFQHPLATDAYRAARDKAQLLLRLATAAVLSLIVVGGLQFGRHQTEANLSRELAVRQAEIRAFEQSPAYLAYVNLTHRLNRSKAYLNGIAQKRASHAHLLIKAMSLNVPDRLNLTAFDLQFREGRYVLQLDGHVKLKDFSPEIILAQYVEELRKSPLFDNVDVTSHQKSQLQGRFELTFQLTMDTRV